MSQSTTVQCVIENFLEIENVLKFDSLETCKGKKAAFDWLGQP